jgi:hypothetical protein
MTTKCKKCGSTAVRIDREEVCFLDADVVARQARLTEPVENETTFSNPRCAECYAPREDISEDDIDEIWSWA